IILARRFAPIVVISASQGFLIAFGTLFALCTLRSGRIPEVLLVLLVPVHQGALLGLADLVDLQNSPPVRMPAVAGAPRRLAVDGDEVVPTGPVRRIMRE